MAVLLVPPVSEKELEVKPITESNLSQLQIPVRMHTDISCKSQEGNDEQKLEDTLSVKQRVNEARALSEKPRSEEGLNLRSAPYVPKEQFQQNKKWFNPKDIFTFDNFFNKDFPELTELALDQIRTGNKLGRYNFPKTSALQHKNVRREDTWSEYPENLRAT